MVQRKPSGLSCHVGVRNGFTLLPDKDTNMYLLWLHTFQIDWIGGAFLTERDAANNSQVATALITIEPLLLNS